ncbi:MAG: alanine racemase [Acidimicrobiia bacterium]|nr:alanine racemase [Acidimicrobiia bacterium]
MSLPNFLQGNRPTWVEVDLSLLQRNFLGLRNWLPQSVKIMPVIKADAYGHGAVPVALRLQKMGADALAVAILEEALVLRDAGVTCPLLLLNGFWPGQENELIRCQLTPVVSCPNLLQRLEEAAGRARQRVAYHLEVDTGMARLGVAWEDAAALRAKHASSGWAQCTGVFTHFSTAEDASNPFTRIQLERFTQVLSAAAEQRWQSRWRHAANSAGILNFRESWLDGVRPGLAIYGVNPLPGPQSLLKLSPILSFKTQVMQVRTLRHGRSAGYGNTFCAERDSRIATLPVGYADGVARELSNRGQVLIRGKRLPIVGRISMDLTLVDATEAMGVETGDEVVLIGTQRGETILVEEVAAWGRTIPYEILARIGGRVPRVYLGSDST